MLAEHWVLPRLPLLFPWPLCFRIYRRLSTVDWLFHGDVEPALAEALKRGWVDDPDRWRALRRLVLLVDHADTFLSRCRSDAWLPRNVDTEGRWNPQQGPSILCTFHWGAGTWALRHAKAAGLRPNVLLARLPPDGGGRGVVAAFVRARYREVERITGRPVLQVPGAMPGVREALARGEQIVAVVDVPPERVGESAPVPLLDQTALMPSALLRYAAEQGIPVQTYSMAVCPESGRRRLRIENVGVERDARRLITRVFACLDQRIRESPAAWHFWGAAGSFLRPPRAQAWDASRITDEWFRAHFHHAADTVSEWLSPHVEWRTLRLLDFGCGDGITDLALALKKAPASITGVDINDGFGSLPATARQQLGLAALPQRLSFVQIAAGDALADRFDIDAMMSWSVFEHVERPYLDAVVADLFRLLPSGGLLFLQIDPLFHAPAGSHLGRFVRRPWAHLLMGEEALFEAVMGSSEEIPPEEIEINFHSRDPDAYKRFVFGEYRRLNRLTADELAALFTGHGFEILRQERRTETIEPPAELLRRYSREVLQTTEIRLLLRRPVANPLLIDPSGAA